MQSILQAPKRVFLFILSFCLFMPLAQADKPLVVASIEPLALIAKELLGEQANVKTLLPDGANPHQYALKISDLALIRQADMVFWNGPVLEPFLAKPLARWKVTELSFTEVLGIDLHEHVDHDPHYWLGPKNALAFARAGAAKLGLSPAAVAGFEQAHQDLLDDWLGQFKGKPGLLVYHDGYSHLLLDFELKQLAAVSAGEGVAMSVSKRLQLQGLAKSKAACMLAEPYSEAVQAEKLAAQLGLAPVWMDVLASHTQAPGYHSWMAELLLQLRSCFKPNK
ncbi:MAG: metal ABC transporter substrate-binding protein [Cellvibrionaceae bacterium]|nr:metal ABC transporter substrate-binding protein [Cellvibrionaceae bacterium]